MPDNKPPTQSEMEKLILIALKDYDLYKHNLTRQVRTHLYRSQSEARQAGFQGIFDKAFAALKSRGAIVQQGRLVMTKARAEQKKKG